jgi:hypothetical protein
VGVVTARTAVEQALAALRSVSSPDDVARSTHDVADEIDRAWSRSPLVAGLEGDLVARSELVNTLVGEPVLDPDRRALGGAPLRIKRGAVMRYRVVRVDETSEETLALAPESREGDTELERRAREARDELHASELALATAERETPAVLRERPKLWEVWLWLLRWLLGLVKRNAVVSWRLTTRRVADTRRKLADVDGFVAARAERERGTHESFYRELRRLCDGGPAGKDVREIELTIPGGMDETIEVVELMGATRASAYVDAVIVVERDGLYAPTPGGGKVELGSVRATLAELPTLLERARALTLARRALAKLASARREIDERCNKVERELQERIQRVAQLALPVDTGPFRGAQLERVRPTLLASINAIMEHASVHLGSELAQLSAEWMAAIISATTNDELKAGIATIEEQWPTSAKRIAEEVRVLLMGGAGGVARDIYVDLVSPLRAHGLADEHLKPPRRAPEIPPFTLLDSLANPSTFTLGGSWFGGLFRSLEARKAEVREKVHARSEHVHEMAGAELLDAEPKLHAAVTIALGTQLDHAITLQQTGHREALEQAHDVVAKEREALSPLVKSGEAIVHAGNQLIQLVNAMQAERPAVAAAAVAAAS